MYGSCWARPSTTMPANYTHKFLLKPGTWVFVPTSETRDLGRDITKWVLKHWRPPTYFYNYKKGGHVRAAKTHANSKHFIKIDIERFFDSITRTKISRALRGIGFSARDSFDIARDCVVKKPDQTTLSLPFGFVQSPIIAALVMDKSAIGNALRAIHRLGVVTTVYVDDIVLSHTDSPEILDRAASQLLAAIEISGFAVNARKTTTISDGVCVFNIDISFNSTQISPERMSDLMVKLNQAKSDKVKNGIWNYIKSVNGG
ncbi:reverse transcriptase domain-containing protein [Xanthobacter sp. ZOL 2024]